MNRRNPGESVIEDPRREGSRKKNLISDMRSEERPYEKCRAAGPHALTSAELLAVILRTGAEGVSVLDMAGEIIDSFGSEGLSGLCSATPDELMQIRGIGSVKAMQLTCIAELSRRLSRARKEAVPVFRAPEEIALHYMEDFRHDRQEKVMMLMLDSRGRLLGEEELSRGTVNAAMVSPREIFIRALAKRAVTIVLIHNHPSGDPHPSEEDVHITAQVTEAGRYIGIQLLDHIVIGDGRAFSFRRMDMDPDGSGIMEFPAQEDSAA